MSYYYWDDQFVTSTGETLGYCYEKYGAGYQDIGKGIRMECIFLDINKSFGNSWCLRAYQRGRNVPIKLYEQHKVYGKHNLKI